MPTATKPERSRSRRKKRKRHPRKRRERAGEPLPKWDDLPGPASQEREQETSFWERLSTLRFALAVAALVAAGVLYVGHVHATKALLTQLQEARTENRRLHLKVSRLQSSYDEATAPSVIRRRAEELGLEKGSGQSGGTIYLGTADPSETSAVP
jgi:cell division protein FtsL